MTIMDYLKDLRILVFILIVLALAVCDAVYGIHLGIEFVGGTQIPITLESSVNSQNMSLLIQNLQQRISNFGLSQLNIQGVGSQEVIIQLPNVSQTSIQNTVALIESQGIFQGVVAGREAINGTGIEGDSVDAVPPQISNNGVIWQVDFVITYPAATRFAKVAFGQANQPLYLFLDRPTNAIVLVGASMLHPIGTSTTLQEISAMQSATALLNATIPVEILNTNLTNANAIIGYFAANKARYHTVILANDTPASIISNLTADNYTLSFKSVSNITPSFTQIPRSNSSLSTTTVVQSWTAIGLVSMAPLAPSVTTGNPGQSYLITGPAPSNESLADQENYSTQQAKTIASILKGGALPVHVIVGTPTTIPPELGKNAELISAVAAVIAVLAVTMVIVIRYRKVFLITPIILTTLGELFIIASIIGLVGTIDLAAVAGMIAVVGTGVDAQIIISDELLVQHSESSSTLKSKLGRAFYVVWADAALLMIAMLPLLFSTSLVTVIGFSESTIIGALLGAVITRPAYGSILTRHFSKVS
jgi:preprotein translocase subunit SecD